MGLHRRRPPPSVLHERIWFSVDSLDPCVYDDSAAAWVQPWPLPPGESLVRIQFTLHNDSAGELSGGVVGHLDSLSLITTPSCTINKIPPGRTAKGELWFSGAPPGSHLMSLAYQIQEGTVLNITPGGIQGTRPNIKTLATAEESYLVHDKRLILTTDHLNPDGAFGVCKNRTFLGDLHGGAPNEWQEISDQTVGVAGVAIDPHTSNADVPFTHPFGLLDFEFYIAPDNHPNFAKLLAPNNRGQIADKEYSVAMDHAIALLQDPNDYQLPTIPGILGVEMDRGLIPEVSIGDRKYRLQLSAVEADRVHEMRVRPAHGDRVVVFGTWIEDCGHDDFRSEIHPPLLIASAHSPLKSDGTPDLEETRTAVVSRPYLVTQRFIDAGGRRVGLFDHLMAELGLQIIAPWHHIEAAAEIADAPWTGNQDLRYRVAPAAPRVSPQDRLEVRYHFAIRSGVDVIVDISGGDEAVVRVTMDARKYVAPPLPPKYDWTITQKYLTDMSANAGEQYDLIERIEAVLSQWGALSTDQGVNMPYFPALRLDVAAIDFDNQIERSDEQPFPLVGWLNVRWRRQETLRFLPSPFVSYQQVLAAAGTELEKGRRGSS